LGDLVFENNIGYCRQNIPLTQKELGKILGVSDSTVSGWETAKDTMPLEKMIIFCNLYNYSLDFLTGLSRKNEKYNRLEKVDMKEVGKKLKELRKNLKMSQTKIADECSISQSAYSNYEIGNHLITSLVIYTLCKNHKLSIDVLLGRKKK